MIDNVLVPIAFYYYYFKMPKIQTKMSREEWLERKRVSERKRKEKIKNDPVKLEELRKREKERYHKKKAEGKIVPLSEMPPRARRLQQKRNRINFKTYYERKKLQADTKQASERYETPSIEMNSYTE